MSHCLKMRVSCLVQGFRFALQSSTTFITKETLPQQISLPCPHMNSWVLGFHHISADSFNIHSLIYPPNFPPLLHSARHQKQGKLSLLSLPPPFLHRIPAFHLSYHHSQKSHGELLHVEAKGKAGWE